MAEDDTMDTLSGIDIEDEASIENLPQVAINSREEASKTVDRISGAGVSPPDPTW